MAYTVGIAACLAAFYFTPASWPTVQWATVFMIGFFLYGPQMLIGLCGAELVRPIVPYCPSAPPLTKHSAACGNGQLSTLHFSKVSSDGTTREGMNVIDRLHRAVPLMEEH